MSITVDISDELLADLGREEVNKEIQAAIQRLELRRMAREAIEELKETDYIMTDSEWQAAGQQAWDTYGHVYTTSETNYAK